MKMTLSELKAQNEAQEANQDILNDGVEMDTEVDSEVEEVNEEHNDDSELEDEVEEVESSDDDQDDSETEEWMVVYQALYAEKGFWTRPLSIWLESVQAANDGTVPPTRFALVTANDISLEHLTTGS